MGYEPCPARRRKDRAMTETVNIQLRRDPLRRFEFEVAKPGIKWWLRYSVPESAGGVAAGWN